jgi:NAD(P)-dependent dehydrogenase (short-subunit alcohol dehydrogenase family)
MQASPEASWPRVAVMTADGGLLTGRAAIVTGGARGLGAAITARLAAAGASGTVIDRQAPEAGQLPPGWAAVCADVRDPAALSAAFDAAKVAGPLRIVVANAGVVPPWTSTADIDVQQWEDVFAINVRGLMLTVREAMRRMRDEGGSIVAMASLNGWRGASRQPIYTASKHAVVGLVRSAAIDAGRAGIRVNAIAPGPIATGALLERMAARAQDGSIPVEEALRQADSLTALGRIATAAEVADTALFLASDMSSGITGQLIAVDAGLP